MLPKKGAGGVRMLVLTRQVEQEIMIGNNIHLTLVAIQGEQVRLGISAPKDVIVDRQEIHDRRTAQAALASVGCTAQCNRSPCRSGGW